MNSDMKRVLQDAIYHIRRTHMNTRAWTLPIADEEAIKILEELKELLEGL